MELKYNEEMGALKFETLNETPDIGDWTLHIAGAGTFNGNGFQELLAQFKAFNSDKTQVVYVKNINVFEIISHNFITYKKNDFKTFSSDLKFFWLRIGNIELRNWDNFLPNVDDVDLFLNRMESLRKVFNKGNKGRLSLESNFQYTLTKNLWQDIQSKYFFYAGWAREVNNKLIPQTEIELELLTEYYKGGFYFANPSFNHTIVENVHPYDISSSHIGQLSRQKFPCGPFKVEEDLAKVKEIIREDKESWIAEFHFPKLQPFEGLESLAEFTNLKKYKTYDADGVLWLRLNDVDFKWFKKVFKWDYTQMKINLFHHSPKYYMPKNFLTLCQDLYAQKQAQKKGSFAKEIFKLRAELPYGQSIKNPIYNHTTLYDDKWRYFYQDPKTESFVDIIDRFKKRNSLPYQYGIWTVSYSRLDLIDVILRIGVENVVYADTDCVKFIGEEGVSVIEEKNEEIDKEFEIVSNTYYMELDDKLGRWANEGEIKRFKSIGVKWYLTEDFNDNLNVKAAGANLSALGDYLMGSKNPFNAFSKDMKVKDLFQSIKYDRENKQVLIESYDRMSKEFKKKLSRGEVLYGQ